MPHSISRSDLLRGYIGSSPIPLRPPWALPENAFIAACTRCGDCIRACPQGILTVGAGGFPEVSFTAAGCTFCADCVGACEPDALSRLGLKAPWSAIAEVVGSCLSRLGVVCRTCGDHCPSGAISFRLAPGGIADPVIETADCTGCGDCVAPCPSDAILVSEGGAGNRLQGASS